MGSGINRSGGCLLGNGIPEGHMYCHTWFGALKQKMKSQTFFTTRKY